MREQIEKLRESAIKAVWKAKTLDDLRVAETHYLGRKGELTSLLRSLADFPEKDRPAAGEVANRAKIEVEREIGKKRAVLEAEEFQGLGENEWTDVTAPGARPPEGHLHLTTQAIGEVTGIFERLGFVDEEPVHADLLKRERVVFPMHRRHRFDLPFQFLHVASSQDRSNQRIHSVCCRMPRLA